jgi:hypothetical protein
VGLGELRSFRQGKARSLLVVSEVSLALVLLIGSALLTLDVWIKCTAPRDAEKLMFCIRARLSVGP